MELRRWALKKKWAEDSARLAWNTRALILSAEEIKKWRKTHEVGKDLH